jgi:hypothetical protein
MDGELEGMKKEVVVVAKFIKLYPGSCVEGLKKIRKNLVSCYPCLGLLIMKLESFLLERNLTEIIHSIWLVCRPDLIYRIFSILRRNFLIFLYF